ncbi:hypothetical protein Goshw_011631 [Gossypium schwendimanii]|uniref:Berberine/berberine-like domain-containing protein n=1 Tax=Gossypium schwendimanii TaxID=34291 RepID=A0A7J9LV72_GOSSC|nr:hypothetical protein [Gossypium schwendimanii]
MGEDMFWAIRGGGGGSFGVVLAWKTNSVPVPANVTVFRVHRMLDQNATNSSVAVRTDKLLQLMEEKFPQLGLMKEDCLEMSWAESDLYFEQFPIGAPLETLLGRNHKSALSKSFFKAKSDFVKQPIPEMVVAQVLQ